uniref:Uncharacterized protein n=1 Tax=Romanomermis culicivorax TaxID=13658 RepID=A0A915IL06_ROMCU
EPSKPTSSLRGVNGQPTGFRARGRGRDPNFRAVQNKSPSDFSSSNGSPKDRSSPIGGSPDRVTKELETFKNQVELAKRPGFGSIGRHYSMFANHFEVKLCNMMTVSQYYVDITHPRLKLTRDENRKLFWTCVTRNRQTFPNPYSLAYDGVRSMFSLHQLQLPTGNGTHRFELNVMIARDDKEFPCSVLFQYVGPVSIDVKNRPMNDRCMAPVQVLDIILRQARQCEFVSYSSDFYSFGSSIYMIPVPHGIDLSCGREIWYGLYTSVHVAQNNNLLVNADVVHTAFYKQFLRQNVEYDVIQFLIDVLNSTYRDGKGPYRREQLNEKTDLTAQESQLFEKEIRGINIRITHRPNMMRVYKVIKVPGRSCDTKFILKDNVEMTVAEYFATHYKALRYPRLPCLHVGSKCRQVYIPAEHCVFSGAQKVMRKLNESQTTTMIRTAATDAPTRMNKIAEMMRIAKFNQDPFLAAFGLQIDNRMAKLDGRVLPPPRIEYASKQGRASVVQPVDGVWRCDNERFFLGGSARAIGVISFLNNGKERMAEQYVMNQLQCLQKMGTEVPRMPDRVEFSEMRIESVERVFRRLIQAVSNQGKSCDLVLVLIPQKNSQFYCEIKRVGEIVLGTMTQCVLERTMNKNAFVNIAQKINMKLGGINSKLVADEVAKKYLIDVPTLIMGVDVTHPSPTDTRSPSIASIVTNTDLSPMRYAASVKIQKHRREAIVYLVDVVRDRLVSFFTESKVKPERILVYRDGVAEGQFQEVLREELRGIREACLTLSQEYRPKVTFIVVQKRHHTRLFPVNSKDSSGKSRNVPPGSVVDHSVTTANGFDFFLCSHFGIQGTSRPTRYHVIYDENNFTADEIQMVTYYLCHMYGRCPRSVSIPAPVYYADLACTRARCHLLGMTGEMGSDVASSVSGGDSKSNVAEDDLIRGATVAESLRNRMYFM